MGGGDGLQPPFPHPCKFLCAKISCAQTSQISSYLYFCYQSQYFFFYFLWKFSQSLNYHIVCIQTFDNVFVYFCMKPNRVENMLYLQKKFWSVEEQRNIDIPMDFIKFLHVHQYFVIDFFLYFCFLTSVIIKQYKNIAVIT